MVNEYVESCLPCNAALPHNPPVPLEPNFLPERAWQNLHCDFKGPIAGKYYLHILIDQYSKFPEVDIVKSTSFNSLKPVLDRVFAFKLDMHRIFKSHGFLKTCGGIRLLAVE